MNNKDAKLLIQKFLNGDCSEREKSLIMDWYEQLPSDVVASKVIDDSNMKEFVLKSVLALPKIIISK